MDFSVLMSVYNGDKPRYLELALRSILQDQELLPSEVILVIDGPVDKSLRDVIQYWLDSSSVQINVVDKSVNEGLACALNDGLALCSYDLVCRMDADDISLPERFSRQISYMVDNPDVDVLGALISEFDDGGEEIAVRSVPQSHAEIIQFAKGRNPISHPVACFRKSKVLDVGGYPLVYPEDYLLWVNMLMSGAKFHNLPIILLRMRTGVAFIERRGKLFLKGEIASYLYMYRKGFISRFELIKYSFGRALVRLAPAKFKVWMYKIAR